MITKQNSYFNPMDNLSFLDHTIFKIKFLIFLISVFPLILICVFFGNLIPMITNWSPVIFNRLLMWLLSIKVEFQGSITQSKECNLFISNHLTYLDIPVLGSVFPIRFVAKSEVQSLPILGFLSKLAKTIFIKRNRLDSLHQKIKTSKILSSGEKIFLFPEGTTSDGNRVLDFKSSLFSAVESQNFLVQPIVIVYSELNGIPINRWIRPTIAWYGNMDLRPHLLKLIALRSLKVKIIYLKPVKTIHFTNRKELTKYLEKKIKKVYSNALSKKLA